VPPKGSANFAWLQMLEDRNLTTHAHDEETLARQVYGPIVQDYASLPLTMGNRLQNLQWD
jgi:hypothetical protein